MRLLPVLFLSAAAAAQTWLPQNSGTTASLRGVSAVTPQVVWASGSGGTWLVTGDGGATWRTATVPGAEALDFRDVRAFSPRVAYLLSSGPGDKSRIYRTSDAGRHWSLQYTNADPAGFFDALKFWDARHGVVLGDPVDGSFVILTTDDGGAHWQRRPTPPALNGEGAFAASGSCLTVRGNQEAWFGTGGPGGARVFHTTDSGRTWTVARTPLRNDAASAGIFSLAFSDASYGIAVGGDYAKPTDPQSNLAITADGGQTWNHPAGPRPTGFRSAVAFLPDRKLWVATGTSGSETSSDGGNTWKPFDTAAYNALSFLSSQAGWAVGPKGTIGRFRQN